MERREPQWANCDNAMTTVDFLKYLVGNREAILAFASSRQTLWLGLLFVLSAGLAREYDAADLLYEPWHALLPLPASLATSLILYTVLYVKPAYLRAAPSFLAGYRQFLSLYWLTAPLACLYAIPYERFLSAESAVAANLTTLGFVAVWRVALMIRVANVLCGYHVAAAASLVLFFADVVMGAALSFIPVPIVNVMGGVEAERTPADYVLDDISSRLGLICILSFPILLLAAVISLKKSHPAWTPIANDPHREPNRPLWIFAGLMLAVGFALLPFTQGEQQLRGRVERLFAAGRLDEAISLMRASKPDDFPPHWDPPPRIGYPNSHPPLKEVLDALEPPQESWVDAIYADKAARSRRKGRFDEPD